MGHGRGPPTVRIARVRGLLLLLAGIAAGFLLGRATSERPVLRRAAGEPPREAAPEAGRAAEPAPPPGPGPSPPAHAPESGPAPVGAPPVAATSQRPGEEESGLGADGGWIEVRFPMSEVRPQAFLHVRDGSGDWVDVEFSTTDTELVQIAEVRAGTHLVWWREPEGHRRLGCRVRVEPGMIASVDAAAAGELPAREGLGRLLLQVVGADGLPRRGVAAKLVVASAVGASESEETTDAGGRCLFEVPPGLHRIRLGSWWREVQLDAGATVEVAYRPLEQGSILLEFDANVAIAYAHVPSGELVPSDLREGSRHLFLALPPGEYDFSANITGQGNDRRPAGRHAVHAATETSRRVQLPAGSIAVDVFSGAAWVYVTIAPGEALPWGLQQHAAITPGGRPSWKTTFLFLPAGEYSVTANAQQRSETKSVTVGTGPSRVVFELD